MLRHQLHKNSKYLTLLVRAFKKKKKLVFGYPTVAHKGHETPAIYFGKFEW